MISVKCIQKFRDKNNHIYGYRLQDINGKTQDVKPENLKQAIRCNQIHVINLVLTSDNRLVDSSEKQLQNNKILGSKPTKPAEILVLEELDTIAEECDDELTLCYKEDTLKKLANKHNTTLEDVYKLIQSRINSILVGCTDKSIDNLKKLIIHTEGALFGVEMNSKSLNEALKTTICVEAIKGDPKNVNMDTVITYYETANKEEIYTKFKYPRLDNK